MPARKILLAMDGSENSSRALEWYAKHLTMDTDELIFIYVTDPRVVAGTSLTTNPNLYTKKINEAVDEANRVIDGTKRKLKFLHLKNKAVYLGEMMQDPGPAIVATAQEEQVDMIIMGNRGQGTLRRTFLGSVSDFVLHHSHLPTIIVPPPKAKKS